MDERGGLTLIQLLYSSLTSRNQGFIMLARFEYRLFLPVAPSLNGAYFNRKNVGRVKTDKTRTWYELGGYALNAQFNGPPITLQKDIRLHLDIQQPNKNSDLSNRIKLIEDLLVKQEVVADDRFVNELHVRWVPKNFVFEDKIPTAVQEMKLGLLVFAVVRGLAEVEKEKNLA